MHKPRHHWHLEQALYVLLIMVGAVVSTVLDVQAISAAVAAGHDGLGSGIAAEAPSPVPPSASRASSSASSKRADATIVARLSR
jgi:hypothetical protein